MSETGDALRVRIRAEPAVADPHSCRFVVDRTLHDGPAALFESAADAAGSPLAEGLFDLSGVASVLVAESVVTVSKRKEAEWAALKPRIGAVIRAQALTGAPAVACLPETARGTRDDAGIRAALQDLLDRETNPAIARHGGHIALVEVREGRAYIRMSGGCQGCAASSITLRQGFERMARRTVPELGEIVDVTDHAAGRQPYYAPGQTGAPRR